MVHEDLRFKKISHPDRPIPKNQVALFVGTDGQFYLKEGSNDAEAVGGSASGGTARAVVNLSTASSTSLTAAQSGGLVLNPAASATTTATLPSGAAVGTTFEFQAISPQAIHVDAPGQSITLPDGSSFTAIESSGATGDFCRVTVISANTWLVSENTGFVDA